MVAGGVGALADDGAARDRADASRTGATCSSACPSRRSPSRWRSAWRVPDIEKPVRLGRSRGAVGRRAHGVRAPALLVDRADRRVRHGLVHGDPGPVGGAVADGGRRATRARARRDHLLAMNAVIMLGYALLGFFGTRLARARHPRAPPVRRRLRASTCVALAAIVLRVPGSYALVVALRPRRRGQRARVHGAERGLRPRPRRPLEHDAQPASMFAGSFVAQWGIGVVVDAARARLALDDGGRAARARSRSCSWATSSPTPGSSRGWKRHGVHAPAPAA